MFLTDEWCTLNGTSKQWNTTHRFKSYGLWIYVITWVNPEGNMLSSRSKFPFENSAGNTLELMDMGNDFLNRTQMAQQLRDRIDKCDYMKLKASTQQNLWSPV
jgi:hypothetical protein